jgi:hypothetical protein
MPKPLRYLFIVLALFGLGLAIWTGVPRRSDAVEESAAPGIEAREVEAPTAKAPEFAEPSVERNETAVAPTSSEPTPRDSSGDDEDADRPIAMLTARFVDKLGSPWPDVLVLGTKRMQTRAASDAEGRITLALSQPPGMGSSWSVEFVVRRKGCESQALECVLTAGQTTTLGDVVLGPGVDVYGRTVDETGAAVPFVWVGPEIGEFDPTDESGRISREYSHIESSLFVESGLNGDFHLEGLPVGKAWLWAKSTESRTVWSDEFTLVEGVDLHGVLLTVPRPREEEVVAGIVLAPDGTPASGAFVSCAFRDQLRSGSKGMITGENGRFRLVVEPGYNTYDLSANDPEQRYSETSLLDVKPGAGNIELRLGVNEPFYLVLRGPDGESVNECNLQLFRETPGGVWNANFHRLRSDGEGRHELPVPTGRMRLEIEAKGYVRHESEKLERPVARSTLEIRLARAKLLRGRVLAQGEPVAGASVSRFPDAGNVSLTVNGFRAVHDGWPEAGATTDAEGRFELPFSGDERQWIRADAPGFAPSELGPLVPDESVALELALVRGGVIEGVVLLPGGADAEGTILGLSRGDGFGRSYRAGPGGRYRFEGLTPGPWQLLQLEREIDPQSGNTVRMRSSEPIEWSCEVRDGRTTRFDLDLSRP